VTQASRPRAPVPGHRDTGAVRRLVRRVAATRPVAWLCARLLHRIDLVVYRASGGRATFSSWVSGLPVVMLTTTGARTGRRGTLPLVGIPDGDRMVLIASNYGRRHNPAWYHNLRAHPRASVSVGGVTRRVTAHELDGEERERYFRRGVEVYPGWMQYRRRAAHRRIPVIRLDPEP
jgi:deazaflavin-dependent oxidoreductase (nitroreductase family)